MLEPKRDRRQPGGHLGKYRLQQKRFDAPRGEAELGGKTEGDGDIPFEPTMGRNRVGNARVRRSGHRDLNMQDRNTVAPVGINAIQRDQRAIGIERRAPSDAGAGSDDIHGIISCGTEEAVDRPGSVAPAFLPSPLPALRPAYMPHDTGGKSAAMSGEA